MLSWACSLCSDEYKSKLVSEIKEYARLHMAVEHPVVMVNSSISPDKRGMC